MRIQLPTPTEIIEQLDRFVLGQTRAKRDLATAVYNHYLTLAAEGVGALPMRGAPQHVLLMGPTGSGKTFLVKTLARILGVPFCYMSATSLVKTGYVGTTADAMIRTLARQVDDDVRRAERGIVFLDEFDKLRGSSLGGELDVSGEGAQIGLLTLMDGRPVPLQDQNGRNRRKSVDSSKILFVCSGAFVGLDTIIGRRLDSRQLGFTLPPDDPADTTPPNSSTHASAAGGPRADDPHSPRISDLVEYGLIPELVGRFATISSLAELSADDLVDLMRNQEHSVLRQKQLFWRLHGIELEFTDGALHAIARRAKLLCTGARGLQAVIESVLDPIDWRPMELVHAGVRRIRITESVVHGTAEPELHAVADAHDFRDEPPALELARTALRPDEPTIDASRGWAEEDGSAFDGWTDEELWKYFRECRDDLDWANTTGSARKWWSQLEEENANRVGQLVRICVELRARKATITEFFLAYVYGDTDDLEAILHYLDYRRLRDAERRKRKTRPPER